VQKVEQSCHFGKEVRAATKVVSERLPLLKVIKDSKNTKFNFANNTVIIQASITLLHAQSCFRRVRLEAEMPKKTMVWPERESLP
jgi:hypothetical protein